MEDFEVTTISHYMRSWCNGSIRGSNPLGLGSTPRDRAIKGVFMKRHITSDTHFGHTNVIAYCARPFRSVKEMDAELIKRWNARVSKDDIVYHLGDFCFRAPQEKVKELVSKLNGRIILVMGNHDSHPNKWYIECGFINATRYPIIVDQNIILSHEPPAPELISSKYFYVFGHTHEKHSFTEDNFENTKCVCVERTEYAPINFNDILKEVHQYGK